MGANIKKVVNPAHNEEYAMLVSIPDGVSLTRNLTLASASLTRPADTATYAAGDVVGTGPATNLTFNNVQPAGSGFIILGARLRKDSATIPSGMMGFRVHLYSSAPTAIIDNAPYNLPVADRARYLGHITLSVTRDLGDTIFIQEDNINFSSQLATGSTTLHGILETIGTYQPTASSVITISLSIAGI